MSTRLANSLTWWTPVVLVAGLVALLLFASATQAAPAAQSGGPDATPNDVNRVAKQLYCPVCPNVPLNVCETQACKDWRELIRQKLSAGSSDQEIIDYFVAQYGPRVLASPPARGFNLLVWVVPGTAFLAGVAGLAAVLRTWSRRRGMVRFRAPAPRPDELPADYVARIERALNTRSR